MSDLSTRSCPGCHATPLDPTQWLCDDCHALLTRRATQTR